MASHQARGADEGGEGGEGGFSVDDLLGLVGSARALAGLRHSPTDPSADSPRDVHLDLALAELSPRELAGLHRGVITSGQMQRGAITSGEVTSGLQRGVMTSGGVAGRKRWLTLTLTLTLTLAIP